MASMRQERATVSLLALAVATFGLHAVVGERYGIFRDELYYLACSDRLALGYVDHPPLSIAILWAARHLLGDSLWAIRLPAWIAGAGAVWTAGLLAREVGGGKFAQVLSALCVVVGPVYLAVVHFYSMNALDVLFWALSAFAFARALSSGRPAWWIALGVLLGLGLENKISTLWLGAGIAAALALTPARAWQATRWPWIAAAIALALFVPHLAWQASYGWPTLEFMRNATTRKMSPVSPVEFLANQVFVQHPVTLPVWLAGLAFLFWPSAAQGELRTTRRALGWLFVVPALILVASGTARANYLSPAFPIVFAGGATALEAHLSRRRALRAAVIALIAAAGMVTAPAGLPVLPVETFITYSQTLRLAPRPEEKIGVGLLPQHYADQFGWPELANQVARIYHALPADEREQCAIFGSNYGRAGAIDFFGPRLGLPGAISGHNNYFLWGPRHYTGECAIIIGGRYEDHAPDFEEVQRVGTVNCRYCMPYENGAAIFLCRKSNAPLPQVWPFVKEYI
jgi:hypothetical protein